MIYSHHISSFCTFDDKNQYYLILNKIRSRFISLSQKTINIDIQQGEKIFSIWHQHVPQEGYSLGLKQTNKQNPLINIWGRKLKILGHGLLKDKGSIPNSQSVPLPPPAPLAISLFFMKQSPALGGVAKNLWSYFIYYKILLKIVDFWGAGSVRELSVHFLSLEGRKDIKGTFPGISSRAAQRRESG